MANSDSKGKRGEREFCRKLREHGFGAIRSAQVTGTRKHSGSADVITSIDSVRFEVKRGYEDVDITSKKFAEWIVKADEETPVEKLPVLAWRKNRQPWRFYLITAGVGLDVTVGIEDFIEAMNEKFGSYAVKGYEVDDPSNWKTTGTFG